MPQSRLGTRLPAWIVHPSVKVQSLPVRLLSQVGLPPVTVDPRQYRQCTPLLCRLSMLFQQTQGLIDQSLGNSDLVVPPFDQANVGQSVCPQLRRVSNFRTLQGLLISVQGRLLLWLAKIGIADIDEQPDGQRRISLGNIQVPRCRGLVQVRQNQAAAYVKAFGHSPQRHQHRVNLQILFRSQSPQPRLVGNHSTLNLSIGLQGPPQTVEQHRRQTGPVQLPRQNQRLAVCLGGISIATLVLSGQRFALQTNDALLDVHRNLLIRSRNLLTALPTHGTAISIFVVSQLTAFLLPYMDSHSPQHQTAKAHPLKTNGFHSIGQLPRR